MPYELVINLPTNKQILPIVIGIAAVVILGIIIALKIFSFSDRQKARHSQKISAELKREKTMDKVVRRENAASATPSKTVHQIKRESRDPEKRKQQEALETNTLVGGTSDAQKEEKHAADYYGQLGISSKRSKQLDKAKERAILNGYLQKSNTAPIRPVYSNTSDARQQQMNELNSDQVGDEANTPALVMDSAAPSAVKYTNGDTYKHNLRQKQIQLKRPSSARAAAQPAQEDTAYEGAIRPEIGTEVSNSEPAVVATVPEEKPDILKYGEEAIIPAAQEAVNGFVPDREVLEQNSLGEAENT